MTLIRASVCGLAVFLVAIVVAAWITVGAPRTALEGVACAAAHALAVLGVFAAFAIWRLEA